MEWFWELETPVWEARIRRLAQPLFAAEPTVIELAIEHARQRLVEQARTGKLTRQNEAYVLTAAKNILIDYSKARYGYRRPPVWIQRLGRLWETVYRLLCILKRDPEEITVDMVKAQQQRHAPTDAETQATTEQLVQDAIRAILRQERDCRQPKSPTLVSLDIDGDDDQSPRHEIEQPCSAVDQVLERADLHRLLETLGQYMLSPEPAPIAPPIQRPSDHVLARLATFAADLRLTDQERLLLRLLFEEGLSARAAAQHLGQSERQVQRQRQRILARIAESLARAGLTDFIK